MKAYDECQIQQSETGLIFALGVFARVPVQGEYIHVDCANDEDNNGLYHVDQIHWHANRADEFHPDGDSVAVVIVSGPAIRVEAEN